jgi:hypothetical protein
VRIKLAAAALVAATAVFAGMPAASAQTSGGAPCADVEIGTARSYACLNQQLGRTAETAHTPSVSSVPTATDPANRTGSFSEAGTRERLGSNFGKSAIPQRPLPLPPGPVLGHISRP